MKLASLFVLVVGVTATAATHGVAVADESAGSPPKLEQAIQRAASEGKPLLLEFGTTWCGPCKQFENTTLVDPKVQAALGAVIWVRYDAEAEPGLAAAMRYNISAYPTFLTVDSHGVERRRATGGMSLGDEGVRQFLAIIADAPGATLDEPAVRARLKAAPNDPAVQITAARWFAERNMPVDAIATYQAIAANPKASPEQRAEATTGGMRLRRLAQWKQELIAEKVALIRQRPELATSIDLAIAGVGTPAAAHELAGKALRAHTDTNALNELVYTAIAVGAYDEAIEAGNRMVGDRKDADLLDTLAEAYYARGNRDAALRVEDEAIAVAKDRTAGLKANRARFETGTDESPDVRQWRDRVTAIWSALDKIEETPPPRTPNPGIAEVQGFMIALRKLGEQTSTACASAAGKTQLAYAKLTIGPDHRVQASQILLDDKAPAALRACLTKALVGQTMPAIALPVPAEVKISFDKHMPH